MSTSTGDALNSADLAWLIEAEAPALAEAIIALLAQPEPTPETQPQQKQPKDAFPMDAEDVVLVMPHDEEGAPERHRARRVANGLEHEARTGPRWSRPSRESPGSTSCR